MPTTESPSAQAGVAARGISEHDLVSRTPLRLDRDPSRVIARLFAPGTRPDALTEPAADVVEHVLALDDADVAAAYGQTKASFRRRHRDLEAVFEEHFQAMEHRVGDGVAVEGERRLLVGAMFTHEIAIEGAALTNPSVVPHPDQSGLGPGELRFVMSARAIGEGHVSCVEFRTGVATPEGEVRMDDPAPFATCGVLRPASYRRSLLAAALKHMKDDDEVLAFLLRRLPERFGEAAVERVLRELPAQLRALDRMPKTVSDVYWFMACQYEEVFAEPGGISERTLWPMSPSEHGGMEDARFVRFTDADGTVDYRATYTANHGSGVQAQMIRTPDFRSFSVSQIFGKAAGNKDLAFFPRQVGGRYLALSRSDEEHNAIAVSEDGMVWPEATVLDEPARTWRLMKAGNCGSPIETEAGWLVLTHGVGPMRVYSMGALLLDLDDPTRVIGELDEPLLRVSPDEQDGYVPNVVYSCGALDCGGTLIVPYGFGDMGIEFATVPIPRLLESLGA